MPLKAWDPKLAIAAVLALALASPSPKAEDAKPAAKAVEVPFELLGTKHMVVKAKLNGKGPFRLVFDLGSPVTLLGNDAARKSGVVDEKAPRSFLFAASGEAKVKIADRRRP